MPKSPRRGKRNTRRRALCEAERRYGPDRAVVVHRFADGWTIRQLTAWSDERREGFLLHHCLRDRVDNGEPYWGGDLHSLRDPDNFPRATFTHFLPNDGSSRGETSRVRGHGNRPLNPEYRRLIREWHAALPYEVEPPADYAGGFEEQPPAPRPTVGLAIIARDEELHLPRLLGSIEGAFDQVVLVDTGSEDRTIDLFDEWAAGQDTDATRTAFAWIDDFAAARNYSSDCLRTDWQCWADADQTIDGAGNLRRLAADAPPWLAGFEMYDILNFPGDTAAAARAGLVRRGARWVGRMHEELICGPTQRVEPEVVCWRHHLTDRARNLRSERRDTRILERWVSEDPYDPLLAHRIQRLREAVPADPGSPQRRESIVAEYDEAMLLAADIFDGIPA
jgi:hypothetical protein